MSRFHSSSSTGSAPGAASSNSTNMSAPCGRGYQVPQTSHSLHPPPIHPLHVPYVCDQQMELSLDPSNIHPPYNRPGNLSSSTTSASTQVKKTKNNSPLSLRLISSSSSSASSSNYSDSCGSYESIDWSALEIKPHPMASKRYKSPTMYSDSIQEEHTSSNFSTGSSDHFHIGSPCINIGLLLDVKAPPPRPFVTDDTSDSMDYPTVKAPPPRSFVADNLSDPFLDHPIVLPSGSGIPPPPPKTRYVFRSATPSPGTTPSSRDSFSAHHTVSISSGSPFMASISLDPFNGLSCSSSVLTEDGSNPPSPSPSPFLSASPQLPVVHLQPRLFRLARPKTFTQLYLQQSRCFSRAKPKTFTQRWSETILEEQVLESRAHIITPVRPLSQSPMAASDSGCEIVAQSPLSDPFCISREPSPSPEPIPSPSPQATPRRNIGRFHDARQLSSSSSSEDESDTTADYPSSLDDDPLDTPEPEATPWTIAPVQSWISRNASTIKTVAKWTIVAAAIILPKILWKWWPEMIHVLVVLAGNPQALRRLERINESSVMDVRVWISDFDC
ncbi:uncharacterized protein Bfra_010823 [Botrytis fragariae]|uniref:Uncharacterized protein n=1 Tax=Botrytis fragariae TaxID=1964551 RepID=A0A8H6EEV9_9HELO|nr:uncharacterized protein Bfra_010823 [Botrytis fragariae]KAF5869626.1 hypothetical protein Bfra_010823 [Botrytis fragariae]